MGMGDVAFQALLGYRADQARQPLASEVLGQNIQQALAGFSVARENQLKDHETRLRLGAPQRGTAAAVSVGAPPADPRRRVFGIPFGRAPRVSRIPPPIAGNVGGPAAEDIPAELLTPEIQTAIDQGQPVFFRPASRNFRPAVMGQDEFRARASTLPYLSPEDPAALLTEPDRDKAFKGAAPRVRAGDTTFLPITDEIRQRAAAMGVDLGDMTSLPVSRRALEGLVAPPKPTKGKEGDELMDEVTVAQLYQDERLTPEQIKKAPKRIKARDYRARRGRLNAKARGNLVDALLAASATGGTGPTGRSAGDSVSEGFGF